MKKTLTRKKIKGRDYYYLTYRKGGKLHTTYLGSVSSTKYKKYLYLLTSKGSEYGIQKARQKNFACGVPIAYVEDGYLIYEYKNGAKEYLNGKMQTVKVARLEQNEKHEEDES